MLKHETDAWGWKREGGFHGCLALLANAPPLPSLGGKWVPWAAASSVVTFGFRLQVTAQADWINVNLSLHCKEQRILSQEAVWGFCISDSPAQTQRFNLGLYEMLCLASALKTALSLGFSFLICRLVRWHAWLPRGSEDCGLCLANGRWHRLSSVVKLSSWELVSCSSSFLCSFFAHNRDWPAIFKVNTISICEKKLKLWVYPYTYNRCFFCCRYNTCVWAHIHISIYMCM